MNTRKTHESTECNLCGDHKDIVYDMPFPGSGGSWGYACEECIESNEWDIPDHATKLIRMDAPARTNDGQTVRGIEETGEAYLEGYILGCDHRQIECPLCGDTTSVEPDATGYTCECGARIVCPPLI